MHSWVPKRTEADRPEAPPQVPPSPSARGQAESEFPVAPDRSETLGRPRLRLYEFAAKHSLEEVLREALEEVERQTQSRIGFVHFVDERRGTRFTIHLPTTDRLPEPAHQPQPAIRAGKETILLVDDEPQIPTLGARLLETMGYDVLAANSGEAALELLGTSGPRISLAILDLTMPGMGGTATFETLRERQPGLPVLIASGFSVDGQAQELLARGRAAFIPKPYGVQALSEKLRELLPRRSERGAPLHVSAEHGALASAARRG